MSPPADALPRDVRAILFAGVHGFFERVAFALEQVPHRDVTDDNTPLGKLVGKLAHRDVGLVFNPLQQPTALVFEQERTMPAHLAGR